MEPAKLFLDASSKIFHSVVIQVDMRRNIPTDGPPAIIFFTFRC
jgi:hypothetical protein